MPGLMISCHCWPVLVPVVWLGSARRISAKYSQYNIETLRRVSLFPAVTHCATIVGIGVYKQYRLVIHLQVRRVKRVLAFYITQVVLQLRYTGVARTFRLVVKRPFKAGVG